MQEPKRGRGRPRITSAEDLQEAAYEIYVLRGYAAATPELITEAIGTSRSTFFNYFRGKSDVFWLQIDRALAVFGSRLNSCAGCTDPLAAIADAAKEAAGRWQSPDVPWIFTNYELIGSPEAVFRSGGVRLQKLNHSVTQFLRQQAADQQLAVVSATVSGALAGALHQWVLAGSGRKELGCYIDSALAPLHALMLSKNR